MGNWKLKTGDWKKQPARGLTVFELRFSSFQLRFSVFNHSMIRWPNDPMNQWPDGPISSRFNEMVIRGLPA
jgi:hypothetical protein